MATAEERLLLRIEAQLAQFDRQMQRALGISSRTARAIETRFQQMSRRLDGIGQSAARNLLVPLSGIGAALSVREIAAYADTWTRAGNKIRAAVGPGEAAARTLQDIYDIAIRSYTSLDAVATAYSRVAMSSTELGISQRETLQIVETVSKALQVSGATAGEANSIITQLTQALGSGVLQGDELRSIRENSIVLSQAIAEEFNTTVGGLKALGEAGELQSARVARAILKARDQVEASYAGLTPTIEQALTNVRSAFTKYIGETDKGLSASARLTEALTALADNFDEIADTAVRIAAILAGALVGKAIGGIIAQFPLAVSAVISLVTAMRTGTGVALAFRGALGPIGFIIGGVAAAVGLMSTNQYSAAEAATAHTDAIRTLAGMMGAAQGATAEYTNSLVGQANAQLAAAEADLARADAMMVYLRAASTLYGLDTSAAEASVAESRGSIAASIERLRGLVSQARSAGLAGRFDDAFAPPAADEPPPPPPPGDSGDIGDLASAYADLTPEIDAAEAAQDALNERLAETQQIAGDALKGFIDDLIQGRSLAESLGGVLQRLGSRLIDSGVDALVGSLFGGGAGGVAGLLGGLFGGSRAIGGNVDAGKVYQVHRDELIVPRQPATVIPAARGNGSLAVNGSVEVLVQFDDKMLHGRIIQTAGPVSAQVAQAQATAREDARRRGVA